jgi:hypothetical protein
MGVCMIEQRRQARKFFDFACAGIGAAGVEDAMAGRALGCVCNVQLFASNLHNKGTRCDAIQYEYYY